MAITMTRSYSVDLQKGAEHAVLRAPLATMDNQAHIFEVQVDNGGEAADLSGAVCEAYFIRADGVTVTLDGTVSGSTASVTLGANCYAVPGRFELAVKLTQGDTVHTILRVEGSVTASRTDAMTGAGTGAQSFDQLIQAVNGAAAEISKRDRVWNLLGNSNFLDPVNQRGQTSVSGTWERIIDRWWVSTPYGESYWVDATVTADGIRFTNENGGLCQFIQRLPRSVCPDTTKTGFTAVGMTSDNVLMFGTFNWIENEQFWQFDLSVPNGKTLMWAALYEGVYTAETLPAYVPKGYAAELMECRRYYYEFDTLVSSESSDIGAPRRMFVTLPVPMRQLPDVTYEVYGGNAPGNIMMQSNTTVDITSADSGYSHLRVRLSAEL